MAEKPSTPKALLNQLIKRRATFAALYSASPVERIQMVKDGVPAGLVVRLVEDLDIPKARLCTMLGVARATIDRKIKDRSRLSKADSDSVLALARMIGQVDDKMRKSSDPEEFDPARWISRWLAEPLPVLGGDSPAAFMDTIEGRALVSGCIAQV